MIEDIYRYVDSHTETFVHDLQRLCRQSWEGNRYVAPAGLRGSLDALCLQRLDGERQRRLAGGWPRERSRKLHEWFARDEF